MKQQSISDFGLTIVFKKLLFISSFIYFGNQSVTVIFICETTRR